MFKFSQTNPYSAVQSSIDSRIVGSLLVVTPSERALRDGSNREAALRRTRHLVLLDPLHAPPILQLKVAHHHWVDIHWALLAPNCGASWRVVHRFAVLLVQVFHGVEHQISVWLLLRAAWSVVGSLRKHHGLFVARSGRRVESVALVEGVLAGELLVEVRGAVATSCLRWFEGQQARAARRVLALRNCHVAVLDDRPAILVEHMFLSKLAKCGSPCKHHVRCLVQRSVPTFAIHNTTLLLHTTALATSMSIARAAGIIVV